MTNGTPRSDWVRELSSCSQLCISVSVLVSVSVSGLLLGCFAGGAVSNLCRNFLHFCVLSDPPLLSDLLLGVGRGHELVVESEHGVLVGVLRDEVLVALGVGAH